MTVTARGFSSQEKVYPSLRAALKEAIRFPGIRELVVKDGGGTVILTRQYNNSRNGSQPKGNEDGEIFALRLGAEPGPKTKDDAGPLPEAAAEFPRPKLVSDAPEEEWITRKEALDLYGKFGITPYIFDKARKKKKFKTRKDRKTKRIEVDKRSFHRWVNE